MFTYNHSSEQWNLSFVFGVFFGDDLQGITRLQLDTWFHAAFVFDYPTRIQSIYINGILESNRIAGGTLDLGSENTVLAYISAIAASSPNNYFIVSSAFLDLSFRHAVIPMLPNRLVKCSRSRR